MRDARLKYAGIQGWVKEVGVSVGNCTRGVDRWPCTGDRVQEGRGGPLRGAIFFRITSIRVRLTADRLLPAKAV